MAHPFKHAESSAKKFGGKAEDYLRVHNWFDESKAFLPDFRHRALRHHAEGIFLCERIFGVAITNSEGKQVPVRYIGEQHVREDLGRMPTAQTGCRKSSPLAGCMGSVLSRTIQNSIPEQNSFHKTLPRDQTPPAPYPMQDRQDIVNRSPTGIAWGHRGSARLNARWEY